MCRRIKYERIHRGWPRSYVAGSVGISDEGLRLIETGRRNPSYPVLIKLEDLFRLDHRALFSEANVSTGEELPHPPAAKLK